MEGKHLVVLSNISFGNRTFATHTLIDCGVTGIAFIDKDFVCHHQLLLTPLQYPKSLKVIDSHLISSGDITYVANCYILNTTGSEFGYGPGRKVSETNHTASGRHTETGETDTVGAWLRSTDSVASGNP